MKSTLMIIAAAMLAVGMTAPAFAEEKHPEMHKAMHALENAKHELEHASHDYGGHRVQAIEHIDAALKELHEGLEYDKTHEGKEHEAKDKK